VKNLFPVSDEKGSVKENNAFNHLRMLGVFVCLTLAVQRGTEDYFY